MIFYEDENGYTPFEDEEAIAKLATVAGDRIQEELKAAIENGNREDIIREGKEVLPLFFFTRASTKGEIARAWAEDKFGRLSLGWPFGYVDWTAAFEAIESEFNLVEAENGDILVYYR